MNPDNRYFDNSIDSRMEQALKADRQLQKEKERKRRKKRNHRRMILLGIALLLIVIIIILLVKCFSTNVYQDSEEFAEFADKSLAEYQLYDNTDVTNVSYEYNETRSIAVRTDKCKNKIVRDFRNSKIDKLSNRFRNESEETGALIVDSYAHKTGNGAVNLVIHHFTFKEDDKDMVPADADVETYLINVKTGQVIDPVQVLNLNYKSAVSHFAMECFTENYKEDELQKGWKKYLKPNDANLNKFIIGDGNYIFIFENNKVLKDETGIFAMPCPYGLVESFIRPKLLTRYINPDKPMVAITFDDGPGGDSEAKILDTLAENNATATFFYQGYRVSSFKDNAIKAVSLGCEIGNHSWDHPHLSKLSDSQIKNQIDKTNRKIKEICGVTPVVARPPYGDYNKSVLKSSGMAEVLWTYDTEDWRLRNGKKVFEALKQKDDLDGTIILMHSIYDETAEATSLIVPWLKEQGYQMVTVSELIKYKTGTTPEAGQLYRKLQ